MARLKAKICTIAGATSGIGERTAEVWVVNSISPGGIARQEFSAEALGLPPNRPNKRLRC